MKKLLTSPATYQVLGSFLVLFLIVGISGFTHCPKGKITICHIPPGNHGNAHEITISVNALQAHLNHGDKMSCDEIGTNPDPGTNPDGGPFPSADHL